MIDRQGEKAYASAKLKNLTRENYLKGEITKRVIDR